MKNLFVLPFFFLAILSFQINQKSLKGEQLPNFVESVELDTLGAQDDLKRTFASINKTVTPFKNMTFNTSTFSYTIHFYQAQQLRFYDTHQQIFDAEQNTYVLSGARLQTLVRFQWQKISIDPLSASDPTYPKYGCGISTSDVISYWKKMYLEKGKFKFSLVKANEVNWKGIATPFKIQVSGETQKEDKDALTLIFNSSLPGTKNVREQVEEMINENFIKILDEEIAKDDYPYFQPKFSYTWVPGPGKKNATIPLIRKPVDIQFDRNRLKVYYKIEIEGESSNNLSQESLKIESKKLKNGSYYCTLGFELISRLVYYAQQKGWLDTELTNDRWGSSLFRFIAGDLYEVLPLLKKNYPPTAPIEGYCNTTVQFWSQDLPLIFYFPSRSKFMCHLRTKEEKIVSFQVLAINIVYLKATTTQVDFSQVKYTIKGNITYTPHGEYTIQNRELATAIVEQSFKRLEETSVFGHGYPVGPFQGNIVGFSYFRSITFVQDQTKKQEIGSQLDLKEEK